MLDFVQDDVTEMKTAIQLLTQAVKKLNIPKNNLQETVNVSILSKQDAQFVLVRCAKSIPEILT